MLHSGFSNVYKHPVTTISLLQKRRETSLNSPGQINTVFIRFYARKKVPLNFDFSGDLIGQKKTDENELYFPFKELGSLEKEPENIRKLCSLEFCDSRQRFHHREYEVFKKVDEFCGPKAELEKKIIDYTMHIRSMVPHCLNITRDKKNKSELVIKIARRKKYLKQLRNEDYERFLWLLKELKIRYIPAKPTRRITKQQIKLDAAQAIVEEQRLKKEEEVRQYIESQKEEYLKSKKQLLEEIEKDIKEYNLDKQEILQNVEDIRYAREQPPKVERKYFASLKVWEKKKMPLKYYTLE